MNNTAIITCHNLTKTFSEGANKVRVLRQVDLNVHAGEQVAIVGPSGAGKSTLLHLLGGLDYPTSGVITITGKNIHELTETMRCNLRNHTLGFVYQFHHLLPEFTVLENVCMPLLVRGVPINFAKEKAFKLLERLKILDRQHHKPAELSGGERQRTAIARALVTDPKCVLADEPTGNLDSATAEKVYDAMLNLNRELKTSIVIVTHDMKLANRMDRRLLLENGILQETK